MAQQQTETSGTEDAAREQTEHKRLGHEARKKYHINAGYMRGGYYNPDNYALRPELDELPAGPFVGVGPVGYKRKDDVIADDICRRLGLNDRLDARHIEIEVKEGVVYLKGEVTSLDMKHDALEIAERVTGVHEVHDRIKVK